MAGLTELFSYYSCLFVGDAQTKPWRLDRWLWATNGHLIVALADDGRAANETPLKYLKATRYLHDVPSDEATVDLAALMQFAGEVIPAFVECEDCDGSGRSQYGDIVRCEHCEKDTRQECGSCGGDGGKGLSARPGTVSGVGINLNLLAFGLSLVPPLGPARIGSIRAVSETASDRVLVVDGVGWRIALMTMRNVQASAPTFALAESVK